MTQDADQKVRTYTREEYGALIRKAIWAFPAEDGLPYEVKEYLTELFPDECVADISAVIARYAELARRINAAPGQPILCIKDRGGQLQVELGMIAETDLRFHVHNNRLGMPGGDVSVWVRRHISLVLTEDDQSQVQMHSQPNGDGRVTYFHIEEVSILSPDFAYLNSHRPPNALQSDEVFFRDMSKWEVLVGREEIEKYLRSHPEHGILPVIDGGLMADAIDTRAREVPHLPEVR